MTRENSEKYSLCPSVVKLRRGIVLNSNRKNWHTIMQLAEIRTNWVTFIGEQVEDADGRILDYWRVEKEDSAIIIPIMEDFIVLPTPIYRHGVKKFTLDFPGGRIPHDKPPSSAIPDILFRELGVKEDSILHIYSLNDGLFINSSFSNQKLYGFVVHLKKDSVQANEDIIVYPINQKGIRNLLDEMKCVQCRVLLFDFLFKHYAHLFA